MRSLLNQIDGAGVMGLTPMPEMSGRLSTGFAPWPGQGMDPSRAPIRYGFGPPRPVGVRFPGQMPDPSAAEPAFPHPAADPFTF
jgi:hypothetical protein